MDTADETWEAIKIVADKMLERYAPLPPIETSRGKNLMGITSSTEIDGNEHCSTSTTPTTPTTPTSIKVSSNSSTSKTTIKTTQLPPPPSPRLIKCYDNSVYCKWWRMHGLCTDLRVKRLCTLSCTIECQI
uniref:ShKT domain-containing protein n=1 Tax=Meloidogyne javanica TaxID=6303 RepID=A0A915LZT9_MELJA